MACFASSCSKPKPRYCDVVVDVVVAIMQIGLGGKLGPHNAN